MAGDDYHYGFVDPQVVAVHRQFHEAFTLLAQLPPGQRAAAEKNLRRVYLGFNNRLRALAVATATDASQQIRERIAATALRPDTGTRPHMRHRVRSRAAPPVYGLETGSVWIADKNYLNQAQGTDGYSYWWAQEYGMPAAPGAPPEAPRASMVGRVIQGFFAGKGGARPWAPPNQSQSGVHPVFIPRSGGPKGTIKTPLKARYFVRDGARGAFKAWEAAMGTIGSQTLVQAQQAVGLAAGRPTRRGRRP
jgi:hypothetical protein